MARRCTCTCQFDSTNWTVRRWSWKGSPQCVKPNHFVCCISFLKALESVPKPTTSSSNLRKIQSLRHKPPTSNGVGNSAPSVSLSNSMNSGQMAGSWAASDPYQEVNLSASGGSGKKCTLTTELWFIGTVYLLACDSGLESGSKL